jgi:hypothetical protein
MRRRSHFALLLLLGFVATGCCQPKHPATATQPTPRIATLLFFGLGTNDGGQIAAGRFDAFVNLEIVTRFPDGFTLLDARGQWREGGIGYAEPSRVLLIVHEPTVANEESIEAIRNAYKQQFKQTAVLRMDTALLKAEF